MLDDWTGEKYVTTHQCYGAPCKNQPPPTSLAQSRAEPKVQAFKIGDMQEHRYPFAKAWKKDAWSASETDHLENIGKIVQEHWDPKNQKFKSHWQVLNDREEAEQNAREEASRRPAY